MYTNSRLRLQVQTTFVVRASLDVLREHYFNRTKNTQIKAHSMHATACHTPFMQIDPVSSAPLIGRCKRDTGNSAITARTELLLSGC